MSQIISYSNPTVSDVRGTGAQSPTDGNSSLQILGSNFGAVGKAKTVLAWASPSNSRLTFQAHDCRVLQDHILIGCATAEGVGAALSWQVYIDGLNSTTPLTAYEPPVITAVSLVLPAVTASTQGGTVIVVDGYNFGPWVDVVTVTISAGAVEAGVSVDGVVTPSLTSTVLSTSNCSITVRHRRLQCALPAGVGTLSSVAVTVLDQTSVFSNVHLVYAQPIVATVSPPSWSPSSSTTVTLSGSGFGTASATAMVCQWTVHNVSEVLCRRWSCSGLRPRRHRGIRWHAYDNVIL